MIELESIYFRRNWENFDKPPAGDLVPLQESEEGQDPDTAFPKTAEDLMALKLGEYQIKGV